MGLEVPEGAGEMFAGLGKTDRTNANLYYAGVARETVEALAEALRSAPTDDPVRSAKRRLGMDWILERKTVLAEFGRRMTEEPTEREIARFQDLLSSIADRHEKLTAKSAVARIRRARLGETGRQKTLVEFLHYRVAARGDQGAHV
jgi:hypothetical protein